MTGENNNGLGEPIRELDIASFDFSTLVGRKITLYAEQFPGKPLQSRVTVANGNTIAIDRGGGAGLVDNLVGNQKVTLKVEYKGEPVAIQAMLRRTEGGLCRISLGETVRPLLRRRFRRVPIVCPLRLATLRVHSFTRTSLGSLRWFETESVNLSGGGAMITLTSVIEPPTYLFVNVGLAELGYPSLVLGQVRHALAIETGRWYIGIQFIPREQRREHLPFAIIQQMPSAVFSFDEPMQGKIEQNLINWANRQS
jgi:hypothetical protein